MAVSVETIAAPDVARLWRPRLGRGRGLVVAALVLLSLVVVLAGAERTVIEDALAPAAGQVLVSDHATDGRIAFTTPLGAAEAQLDGAEPYVMPAAIRLQVGDDVVVTNDDIYPHIILSSLAMPGATTTMAFDEPGVYAFSSGCTANGGTINSFTSVIVSERA